MTKEQIFARYNRNANTFRELYKSATTDYAKVALTAARRLEVAHRTATRKSEINVQQDRIVKRIGTMSFRHDDKYMTRLNDILDVAKEGFKDVLEGNHDSVYHAITCLINLAKKDQKAIAKSRTKKSK